MEPKLENCGVPIPDPATWWCEDLSELNTLAILWNLSAGSQTLTNWHTRPPHRVHRAQAKEATGLLEPPVLDSALPKSCPTFE